VIRSGSPVGDCSRVTARAPGTEDFDATADLPYNWMNVVKGASGDVRGVLSAFGAGSHPSRPPFWDN
jgi:hypothetical protein